MVVAQMILDLLSPRPRGQVFLGASRSAADCERRGRTRIVVNSACGRGARCAVEPPRVAFAVARRRVHREESNRR